MVLVYDSDGMPQESMARIHTHERIAYYNDSYDRTQSRQLLKILLVTVLHGHRIIRHHANHCWCKGDLLTSHPGTRTESYNAQDDYPWLPLPSRKDHFLLKGLPRGRSSDTECCLL